jgi:ribonuclease HII
MLRVNYSGIFPEAGCDEAGRGCLAGPVVAAAVVLPKAYSNDMLNDSKKLSEAERFKLRDVILKDALSYSVAFVSENEIDKINILNASIKAMHLALDKLSIKPKYIIIDGNKFKPYHKIPHACIVKGDSLYQSISAASILAKTFRDEHMKNIHERYPQYGWIQNKGYPTLAHRRAVLRYGFTSFHRKTFRVALNEAEQLSLFND